ncbi:MAG: hypothetical protein SAK29_03565 [Scytonema sp. PMC 1069.18]|nr:hypothetical protein [Scytonema sp. PMC 1069.18]MEC4881041.1 hypothetical protein [Scytonema sp. PMC 1070.18]
MIKTECDWLLQTIFISNHGMRSQQTNLHRWSDCMDKTEHVYQQTLVCSHKLVSKFIAFAIAPVMQLSLLKFDSNSNC